MGRRPGKRLKRRKRWPWIVLGLLLVLAAAGAVACGVRAQRLTLPWMDAPAADGPDQSAGPAPQASQEFEEPEEPQELEEPEESQDPREAEETGEPQQPDTAAQARELLDSMTLRERVLQMFIVTPEQLAGVSGTGTVIRDSEAVGQAIQTTPVGGVIYFADNIVDPEQCTEMIAGLQSCAPTGLFIAVDEEGGTVARLGRNSAMGMTAFPSMQAIGDTGDPSGAYEVGLTIGSELGRYGFNLDFAPVTDVNSNPDNPVIGERAFSSDAQTAAEMVASCVQGFSDSGMLCTLKHFPGHGDTAADSHLGAAETGKTLEELEACELLPFRSGIRAGAAFVMVGHIAAPNVTGDQTPASLSYEITTELLREELGFVGVAVTDSMQMRAVTDQYGAGEAAVRAIQAGIDIILMPEDLDQAVEGVLDAVRSGEIPGDRIDESVLRILTVKLEQGIIPLND